MALCANRVMVQKTHLRSLWPALAALALSFIFVGLRLSNAGWDALALVELPRESEGVTAAPKGYDGQFAYYIAIDPAPREVAPKLDAPAYRYQRILYPLLARVLALADTDAIPWTMLLVNIFAHFLGTWAVAETLVGYGVWPGYALGYGLWIGLVVGVGTDLTEPCAYALSAAGWLACQRERNIAGPALLGLGLFAKETGIFFWAAMLAAGVLTSASRKRLAVLGIGGLAFAIWQVWLWSAFGQPGIGSGGALATPFEWFPFMGLWRIAAVSIPVFLLYLVIFGPSILFPTVWGIIVSLRAALAGLRDPEVWGLLLNAAIIPFLPFSTFREPLGIVRVASGLVLATVLFAARYGLKRPLNYSLFWSGMLVILLNG